MWDKAVSENLALIDRRYKKRIDKAVFWKPLYPKVLSW